MNLELYVEDISDGKLKRVDLFPDETVQIKDKIKDSKDVDKVFTAFTQSFTIPASKINNRIFKHYYNNQIDNGFDARFKVRAELRLAGDTYKLGKISLTDVKLTNGLVNQYSITFFGPTVGLKDLLGDDELSDLNEYFTKFKLDYGAQTVIDGFTDGFIYDIAQEKAIKAASPEDADIIVPFISAKNGYVYDSDVTEQNSYNTNQAEGNTTIQYRDVKHEGILTYDLKFAVRVKEIINAIQDKYGIAFSDDFFSSSNEEFHKLFLWLSRERGQISQQIDETSTPELGIGDDFFTYDVSSNDEDVRNAGDHSKVKLEARIQNFRQVGSRFYLNYSFTPRLSDNSIATSGTYGVKVVDQLTGKIISQTPAISGVQTYQSEIDYKKFGLSGNGSQDVKPVLIISTKGEIASIDVELDNIKKYTITYGHGGYTNYIETAEYNDVTLNRDLDQGGEGFSLATQMPKMKIIKFLTGLFKLFNLVAYEEDIQTVETTTYTFKLENIALASKDYTINYVDKFNDNVSVSYATSFFPTTDPTVTIEAKTGTLSITPLDGGSYYDLVAGEINTYERPLIVVKTYNSYFGEGKTVEIDHLIDSSEVTVEPAQIHSAVNFKFEETNTVMAINSNEATGDVFGDEEANSRSFENEHAFTGDKYEIKPGFGKMMFERMYDQDNQEFVTDIQWGWAVDKDYNPVSIKPLLFYNHVQTLNEPDKENEQLLKITSGKGQRVPQLFGQTVEITEDVNLTLELGNTYFRPSNSLSAGTSVNPKQSINFGSEFDEWIRDNSGALVENPFSIFDNKYLDYIGRLFDKRSRVITLTGHVDSKFIHNYKLEDTLRYKGQDYLIEEIDINLLTYKANFKLMTKVDVSALTSIVNLPPSAPEIDITNEYHDSALFEVGLLSTDSEGTVEYYKIYTDVNGGRIENILDAATVGTTQEITLTGLAQGTDYDVYCVAIDELGAESDPSNKISITTSVVTPTTPTIASGTITSTGITVNVSVNSTINGSNVPSYEWYVDGNLHSTLPAGTSLIITGLNPNDELDIQAKGRSGGYTSAFSNTLALTTTSVSSSAPTLASSYTYDSVSGSITANITIPAIDSTGETINQTEFKVYKNLTEVATVNFLGHYVGPYTLAGVVDSSGSWQIQVRGINTFGVYSEFSNTVSQSLLAPTSSDTTAPNTPVLTLNYETTSEVQISMSSSDNVGITKFHVYRKELGGVYNILTTLTTGITGTPGSTQSRTYTDSSVVQNKTYNYKVQAVDAANNVSFDSNQITAETYFDL